jgi:acyl-homoserine lactone acylase PvdQ
MRLFIFLYLLPGILFAQPFSEKEITRWTKKAQRVTVIRDQWGIAHVYGKTDADAVFGFLYAQCEDDFPRVEMNYINAVARLAEVEGESKIYNDLRMRLFYDTLEAISIYDKSPRWLKKLCDSFADGVNYYLYTHPDVKPKLLKRFQPWMPFLFSEGSIGGDIETISVNKLKEFYGEGKKVMIENNIDLDEEPRGSNGFAIAPSKSATGNALLLINPHTSFYFRPEIHMSSKKGLNAYGAVTWGQFFIYQGFNQYCGWMHTSSRADAIDHYKETISSQGDSLYFYKHGGKLKPVLSKKIWIAYKNGESINHKEFIVYYTHHGPVIAKEGDGWLSISLMKEPLNALMQSYKRTKAKDLTSYEKVMDLKGNSSNNTVFADTKGNIAYWHGNYIPIREKRFDWSKTVDGSDPSTDWKGLHAVNEIVHIYNPSIGWIQNCNSTPFTVAGDNSPKKENYPEYMAPDAQNARGLNAERVLNREDKFTLDGLIDAAYDPYLTGFEKLIPSISVAYDRFIKVNGIAQNKLQDPVKVLNAWDLKFGVNSVATTLAIFWGQELISQVRNDIPPGSSQLEVIEYLEKNTSYGEKMDALTKAIDILTRDFGTWHIGWGEVNRFQRLTGKIVESYDDKKPSLPVPYTSSFWGSLAAYGSRKFDDTKKMYGYVGNSFVAVVEFGKTIKAKSLLAGGVSSDPHSPYFTNQAERYTRGQFKDVFFYKEDVIKNASRTYHPGK